MQKESKPDFNNLLKVLDRRIPDRPTLFEFFLNRPLYEQIAGTQIVEQEPDWQWGAVNQVTIAAY